MWCGEVGEKERETGEFVVELFELPRRKFGLLLRAVGGKGGGELAGVSGV